MRSQKRTAIKRRRRRQVRYNYGNLAGRILGSLAVCLLVVILCNTAAAASKKKLVVISLKAQSQSILQDEAVPEMKAEVSYKGDPDEVIGDSEDYTIKDLAEELSTTGCEISCQTDGKTEGEFPIQVTLTPEMEEQLSTTWLGLVKVEKADGKLTVKNKYGEWDGKKFKRHDGNYVKEDFIESKGARYYFDKDGNMVTGELKKGFKVYTFGTDGKLVSEESSIDLDKPMIALTFDDGPGARTGELLAKLEEYNAHATFYMLGQNINDTNGKLLKKMVDIGCEVADHSYSHPQLTKLSADKIKEQMSKTEKKIEKASGGVGSLTMRPPYGAINDNVRANIGFPMILWSVDTLDWKTRNAQATIDHVMNNVRDGDIILMHDIHTQTIDAALTLIPKLQQAGYQLVTVSELAEARGVKMEKGKSYSEFWKQSN